LSQSSPREIPDPTGSSFHPIEPLRVHIYRVFEENRCGVNGETFKSSRHFEVDSQHTYQNKYSETVSSDAVRANSYDVPRQNSQDCFLKRQTPFMEPVYNKTGGLRPPQWPPYMPPAPPIPHEYYVPSPETPSSLLSSNSTVGFDPEKLDCEAPSRKRRVRFSDSITVRILFGGVGEEDREFVVDTQLVDVFGRFGPVLSSVPFVLWLLHSLIGWM